MDYEKARTALGLTLQQFADVLDLPLGMYMSVLANERVLTKPRQLLIQAYLEGFRPAGWPIEDEVRDPDVRLYMVEILGGGDSTRWVPVRAKDDSQAIIHAAIMHGVHAHRVLTVKEM